MKHPPANDRVPVPQRRRLSIDVYFVLYLTAIVLLLGTAPIAQNEYEADLEEAIAQLVDTDFSVDVDRIGMFIPVESATPTTGVAAGNGLFRGDTINEIRATGSFERVRFRIVDVVDTISGASSDPENALLVRTSDSTARFVWTERNRTRPAVFLVRVEGRAAPRIPSSVVDEDLRGRIESILEEKNLLRDTAEFFVHVINPDRYIAEMSARPAPGFTDAGEGTASSVIASDFLQFLRGGRSFSASLGSELRVYAEPGGTWSRQVVIAGADPEDIRVLSPSDIRITGRNPNYIEIAGQAPFEGSRSVELTLQTVDREQVTLQLDVHAVRADWPDIPDELFSGTEYRLDLRARGIDQAHMTVTIVEKGAEHQTGLPPVFTYAPRVSEGTTVEFVRYVNGQRFDSRKVTVRNLRKPEVTLLRDDGDSIIVQTVSWGQRTDGRPNRAYLTVLKGQNAAEPRPVEDPRVDQQNWRILQTWSVPRKNPRGNEEIVLQAHDYRGLPVADRITIAPR